jgi:hypothetical protein
MLEGLNATGRPTGGAIVTSSYFCGCVLGCGGAASRGFRFTGVGAGASRAGREIALPEEIAAAAVAEIGIRGLLAAGSSVMTETDRAVLGLRW